MLYGQRVTVTVVPPGTAEGVCQNYRPNVPCKGYRYGRRERSTHAVKPAKIHPLIQEVQ